MKKLLLIATSILMVCGLNAATKVAVYWDFNSVTADKDATTGTLTPRLGKGRVIAYGGVTMLYASGYSKDPAASFGDNSRANFSTFPSAGSSSGTAGAGFTTSTKGIKNVMFSWVHRHSNTVSKYAQLQYSTDGTNWTNYKGKGTDSVDLYKAKPKGDTYFERSADLTGLGLDDKDSIFLRVVSVFAPGTSDYEPSTPTLTYATTGTYGFDLVTVYGDSMSGTTGGTKPGSFSIVSPVNKTKITVDSGSTKTFTFKWNSSKGANEYAVNLYAAFAPTNALTSVPSDKSGADTILTLVSGDLFAVLKNSGFVKPGGNVDLLWDVTATETTGGNTTNSTNKFDINITRAKYTTIDENEKMDHSFLLFPNPASNVININNIKIGSMLSIVDATGKVVVPAQLINNTSYTTRINLVPGMYFVRISGSTGSQIQKLMVK